MLTSLPLGNYPDAVKQIKRLLQKDPNNIQVMLLYIDIISKGNIGNDSEVGPEAQRRDMKQKSDVATAKHKKNIMNLLMSDRYPSFSFVFVRLG